VSAPARGWVLVLGASSGMGAAACRAFAAAGHPIFGVHLDRASTAPAADAVLAELQAQVPAVFHNRNAADDGTRAELADDLAARAGPSGVAVLVHSLAFGTLTPLLAGVGGRGASRRQLDMTMDVMAHSLVYWSQALDDRGLLGPGARIFALTSSGSRRALPAYGPVSAAKAALEAHVRQLALELAPRGVAVNAVMAGVTDTPALRKIPGHEALLERAAARNPHGRVTRPADVGAAMVALAAPALAWMTGNVIRVDGGEDACA
jgi:enoyl-[acyl-carrier protein] reductase III